MTWLFTLLAMAVIALVAGVVTGRISGGMDAPESSLPFRGLPPDGVVPEDVEALRFTPALRGYRMNQVDEVLDRLGQELRWRDDEIGRLRAALDLEPGAGGARPGGPGAAAGDVRSHLGSDLDDDLGGDRRGGFGGGFDDALAPPASPSESPQRRF
ncbi:MAG TPA: DivIVA domain-containing protein [Kineosporiaceae bacterium]